MTNRFGTLEREVIKSSVMPSLKYSCSRSPLTLTKGSTAIEGMLGNGSAVGCDGAIDGTGGRSEKYCTNTITAAMSASTASENTPRRIYFRATLWFLVVVDAPGSGSSRNTRIGSGIFLSDCGQR